MTRAIETVHISVPPSGEIEWRFRLRSPREKSGYGVADVRAQSWYAARDLAARALGVTRDEVELVR